MKAQICNMTCTVNLGVRLDVETLQKQLGGRFTKGFSALVYRITPLSTTALIYNSGKVVLLGSKSRRQAHYAATLLCRRIGSGRADKKNIIVHNIVGVIKHKPIDLLKLQMFIRRDTAKLNNGSLEPELFPNLVWVRNDGSKTMFYRSGKVIITGVRTNMDLATEAIEVSRLLEAFDNDQRTQLSSDSGTELTNPVVDDMIWEDTVMHGETT